jgi:hypothetical protein
VGASKVTRVDTREKAVVGLEIPLATATHVTLRPTTAYARECTCTIHTAEGLFSLGGSVRDLEGGDLPLLPGAYSLTVTRNGGLVSRTPFFVGSSPVVLDVPN